MTSPTTMVFVIDDDESVRKSLERMLETGHGDILMCTEAMKAGGVDFPRFFCQAV